ncbi:DUF58 domain-containing protein [Verrucomicrobiales bacterium]|nr:DUF58 domain-containing protein [Verrucomicrobiales bacterium]MDC3353169.1 DUF58 domain-containing protein [Verrucomicrobiales bacterium]
MSETTQPSFSELLPPEIINMIGRLEFLARNAKEGTINGRHTSPHKGFSVEFAEHRQYVAGDDLRNLDWRVYGKSDRYYIKQFIEETNMRVTLLVDASGSMNYSGDAATSLGGKENLSKFEYARYLAAALSYLLIRQQDAVGLVTFAEEVETYLRPAAKPSQVRTILEELSRTEPSDDTRCADTFHQIAEQIPSRGLVIVISDLFDDAEAIKNALHHFRFKNHELVVFHLMAEEEITFPFERFDDFKCLEVEGRRLNIDPSTIRASYLDRVSAHLKAIELACGQMEADYVPINTKTPVPEALFTYFSQRKT